MDSIQELWNAVLSSLSGTLTPTAMTTWFSEVTPLDLVDDKLIILTTNNFKKDILLKRFGDQIRSALTDLFSAPFELEILTPETYNEWIETENEKKAEDDTIPAEMAGYTFDRFIVGPSNQFAHAAASNVAENPGGNYNPLFIYGNSGLGKTHLMLAIGHHILEKDKSKKVAYVKGDDFTNRMVKAIHDGKTEEFRKEFRNIDLLLMDDIQFIAGKQSTQNEFFHTFNALYEAGKQIVITSDRPPKEMATLEDRLRTRFEGGLMADIQPPDLETREVIIKAKAAQLGLILTNEAVEYIAKKITKNVRSIEGAVKKITAFKEITNREITLEDIKKIIESLIIDDGDAITPKKILTETARFFNLTEEEIRGQSRQKNIAEARQISMYLMRILTEMSLVDIGNEHDNRHHSTVLTSIRKVEELIKTDSSLRAAIKDITANVNSNS